MSYVISGSVEAELPQILERELDSEKFKDKPVVIHSGHYFLNIEDGEATDYMHDPDSAKPAFADLVRFSTKTWEVACDSVAARSTKQHCQLMVLVNDWQHVIPKEPTRRQREQKADHLRMMYYIGVPSLPWFHLNAMTSRNLDPWVHFFPFSCDQYLFSESRLRARFATTLKTVMKDPVRAAELGVTTEHDGNNEPIISLQTDGQSCTLLHCGNANCAGEVVELLKELYERGVRNFINIYPGCCHIPVESGTEISRQLFGLDGMEVVNIAVR
jgi:hypothetical protein